jgi:pimeloyl-ACP methyl ester carboxylesterase
MHSLSSRDGVDLSYRSFGAGPTTVVLVHGWMVSGAVYDDLIDALGVSKEDPRVVLTRDRLRLVIPDLRGTGASGKPDGGYTIAQYAEDVLAVADAVRAGSFVIVGHSMGGQIAQWIAATSPERVRGAALLCPVPASGMALPDEARALFRGSGQDRQKQAAILGMACKALSDEARERLLDDAGRVAVPCIEQGFDAWSGASFADKLEAIRAPTLVVATDDPFLPPDFLRSEIVARIPRADLAYLPGAGHYPQVERPRETAAVLRAFLAGLSG